MDVLRTHLAATLRDIAVTNTHLFFQQLRSGHTIERMHLESGNANKEAWTTKLFVPLMIPQHVTDVLTEKTLDTLAKFLYAIDIALVHLPFGVRARRERRDLFVDPVIPGNVRNQILDEGKTLHWLNGNWLIHRQRVEARLAR